MSATWAPKAFDTHRLTLPSSDGRAMEFRQFLNKQIPFMKQETLPKELFTKLVPFPSEKAQELLDKLKDNTLNDRLLRMHLFDRSGIVSSGPIDIHNVSSRNSSMIRQER